MLTLRADEARQLEQDEILHARRLSAGRPEWDPFTYGSIDIVTPSAEITGRFLDLQTEPAMPRPVLTLLGDSILDNAPYTGSEPDTTGHLRRLLGPDWSVERLALDGAIMADVPGQLARLDTDPDLAVLSVGGNDALTHIGLLERQRASAADVLAELLAVADAFEARYEAVAGVVAERASRTVLCTIYEVPLEPSAFAHLVRAPLAVLNDRIIRTAVRLGADVLELRTVCTDPEDFVRQIEPSARGAAKIAEAIGSVAVDNGSLGSARVFGS